MKFTRKMILIMLLIGLIPVTLVATVAIQIATHSLEKQAFNQLESVRESKTLTIKQYLTSLTNQVEVMAIDPSLQKAMSNFRFAYEQVAEGDYEVDFTDQDLAQKRQVLKQFYRTEFAPRLTQQDAKHGIGDTSQLVDQLSDTAVILQEAYIVNNANPIGNKDALVASALNFAYDKAHEDIHTYLSDVQKRFGFYDIFLVSNEGDIVYSVFKEIDYATSLTKGPFAHTGLGQAFENALARTDTQATVVDFAMYLPSYNSPAAFIAAPMHGKDGHSQGVIIAQFPLDNMNKIMGERVGLGKTGETYLVGDDLLMRSDSFLDSDAHSVVASFLQPETGKIETLSSREALSGKAGIQVITGYQGQPILSAYAPLAFSGLQWAIFAEIDKAEAYADVYWLYLFAGGLLVITILIVTAVALYTARSVLIPIGGEPKEIQSIVEQVAAGDLTYAFNLTGKETGIYRALATMVTDLRALIQHIVSAAETQASTAHELASTTEQANVNLHTQHQNTMQVATAMHQMSSTVNEVAQNTSKVAESTKQARAAVIHSADQVAAASQSMQKVAQVLSEAGRKVDDVNHKANDISGVLQTIKGIADQTNLLALNAAIEAARAGDQGRGFAVVADEVRTLALNTQKETEQIASIIQALQQGSNDAKNTMALSVEEAHQVAQATLDTVESLKEAVLHVEQSSDMLMQIASAAEEQSSVAVEINQNIHSVNAMSTENEQAMGHIARASEELATLSEQLNHTAKRFTS
ncbi:methyl-accepting chemotaxis protein [Marinomonas sp. IMCC 4694]|uniref:methyl-accepting chemotaxis protein n=1 Tax=Marinomonas sp. IMCC 4694 TaxID=2605432 RepID=UPI001652FEF2|nr:methyl-accepting chemotaxis protein [Marinomonas sp. IMCC 4694]